MDEMLGGWMGGRNHTPVLPWNDGRLFLQAGNDLKKGIALAVGTGVAQEL